MKKNLFTSILLSFLFTATAFSQFNGDWYYGSEYLRFGNVRETWETEQGTITDVEIKAELKGCFAEIKLAMTFDASENEYYFGPEDQLEVQMCFALPEHSVVTDMYLWIEGEKVQAGIYDRWKAQQVYESIVQRRQDPAFLRKSYNNLYELSVFPMLTTMPRKVEITYITPVNINSEYEYSIPLPLNILKLADKIVSDVDVKFISPYDFSELAVLEDVKFSNSRAYSENNKNIFDISIQDAQNYGSLNLTTKKFVESPVKIHYFNHEITKEKYYCGEFYPSKVIDMTDSKNIIFLLDFPESGYPIDNIKKSEELKQVMKLNLKAGDKFNIIYYNKSLQFVSENMIEYNPETIDKFLNSIPNLHTQDNISELLKAGIKTASSIDNTSIVLISTNTDYQYYYYYNFTKDYQDANILIEEINKLNTEKIKINCVNLIDGYFTYYYAYGSSYLFQNIAAYSGGNYYDLWQGSMQEIMAKSINSIYEIYPQMKMEYSVTEGFTYSEFELTEKPEEYVIGKPINTLGKFRGGFPFYFEYAIDTELEKEYKFARYEIPEEIIEFADSTLKTVWTAKYLEKLGSQAQSNANIQEIIELSIANRVLTQYTAFLALEPQMNFDEILEQGESRDNGLSPEEDGDISTDIQEIQISEISCSPNPTKDFVNINFSLNTSTKINISIFDVQGKKIQTIISSELKSGEHKIKYDISAIPCGIYILEIKSENGFVEKIKLVKN